MSNLYYAASYKNKIINLLIRNPDFVTLINPTPSKVETLDMADILLGGEWIIDGEKHEEQGYIFDYNFVDDTTSDDKTFVFVETDIESVRNSMFTDFNLYICVFTTKHLVRLTSESTPSVEQVKALGYCANNFANRIDILCDIVDRILNGVDKLPGIGEIKPAPKGYVTIYNPNSKYYGKCLKYNISNLNETEELCGN